MSHFAKVVDGIVQEVIVAEQDFIDTLEDKDLWIQTSYNTMGGKRWAPNKMGVEEDTSRPPLRGNYAFVGGIYDSVNDKFYVPKPFPSAVLDTTSWGWGAPIAQPTQTDDMIANDQRWKWDEDAYQADTGDPKTKGWVVASMYSD
tara:strand:- start:1986 stop:2420 length:435 start_codon:yes stop_codon:yes gene_type:complete